MSEQLAEARPIPSLSGYAQTFLTSSCIATAPTGRPGRCFPGAPANVEPLSWAQTLVFRKKPDLRMRRKGGGSSCQTHTGPFLGAAAAGSVGLPLLGSPIPVGFVPF